MAAQRLHGSVKRVVVPLAEAGNAMRVFENRPFMSVIRYPEVAGLANPWCLR